jgi:electron transfer flavoprotein beta subunit
MPASTATQPPHAPLPLPRLSALALAAAFCTAFLSRALEPAAAQPVVPSPGAFSPEDARLKIAVCLKRVADTVAKIAIGPGGKSIDESGLKFVLNPYDEFAVEEAIALKEKAGTGETVAYSVGTDAAQETLRAALAMGIDRGVLLQHPGSPDGLEVAKALAAELRSGGFDLILFGKLAVDDYNHQVGVMVAELLDLPCISSVARLTIADGAIEAEREIEGGLEAATCRLPAVLTCDKGLNNPRLPSLKGIMAAKKKPLESKPTSLGAGSVEVLGFEYPAERQAGRIVGEGPDAVPELLRLLRAEAKVL